MNMRRGLFRVWVIFAAIFVVVVFYSSFDDIRSEFEKPYYAKPDLPDFRILVPIDCTKARGKKAVFNLQQQNALADARAKMPESERKPLEIDDSDYSTDKDNPNCWYELPKFRALYPEYKDLRDEELVEKLYDKIGVKTDHPSPWKLLFRTIAQAVGIPLILLIFGRALFWAFAGFRTK